MENMFLDLGLSWTLSKTLPYVLAIILGLLVFWLIRKRVKSKLYRWLLVPVIFIPFGIYFVFNPIYEGDFSNNVRAEQSKEFKRISKERLTVIAIPGCPYCKGSIPTLKKYIERTNKKVDFIVLSSHREMMADYKREAKGSKINVKLALTADLDRFSKLAKGSFPAFVYRKGDKIHVWNNDGFGVRALDWVESN